MVVPPEIKEAMHSVASGQPSSHVCVMAKLLQPIIHSVVDYGSWFSPKRHDSSAAGVDRGRIKFIPQTNRTSLFVAASGM